MIDISGEWPLALAAIALAAFTLARPGAALFLVLSSLPLFAHKTGSPWGLRLLALSTAFLAAYALRHWREWRAAPGVVARNRILLLTALYAAASLLSLATLPLLGIARQHAAAFAALPLSTAASRLTGLLTSDTTREYPVLSVVLTFEASILGLIAWREVRRTPSFLLRAAHGITLGLAAFVALGLLDFVGAVSLREWRGEMGVYFDPTFLRLQSIAGNPGWFSQQVVYTVPFAVVLLGSGRARIWRLAAFATLIATSGVALLFSYQRGGWIAGTAVLLFVVGARTRAELFQRQDPEPKRWTGKLRVSLLVAVAVVVLVAFWLSPGGLSTTTGAAAPYVARIKSITDQSSRVPFFQTGYMIGALHPILGAGSESYGYRYAEYFEMEGGAYHRQPIHPLMPGSAHNVYLQTFAGKGLVGLALLVAIFASCFCATLPLLWRRSRAPRERAGLIAVTGSLVGFALYGVVQEIFYVPSLQLLFFAVVGMIAALTHERVQSGPGIRRVLWAALAFAFLAHLTYEYVYPGQTRLLGREPSGFFAEERDPAGVPFRWATDRAFVPVPHSAKAVSLEVRSVSPYAQQTDITVCGQPVARLELTNQDWRPMQSQTAAQACQALPYLEIRTVPAWVPGADPRLLGVMVRKIEFR